LGADIQCAPMSSVASMFEKAAFIQHLGIRVVAAADGRCETVMPVRPEHLQQDGFVHAGVLATIADHTAGGAAGTLLTAEQGVLSIEFKINMLRPAKAAELSCRATVLRGGKTISVTESEVYAGDKLCAKATVTLAVVPADKPQR
jgi:uncharacterized protein (TIGR00369 family)